MLCATRYQGFQADIGNTGGVTARVVSAGAVGLTGT